MAKKNLYQIVTFKMIEGQTEAEAYAQGQRNSGSGRVEILPVVRSGDRCKKGADHAHAAYDGATWCDLCGKFLHVKIEKNSGMYRP